MSKNTLEPEDHVVDTALVPDDDAPNMTDDGYSAVSPNFDYDEMLEAVEDPDASEPQAELPPQEAYELAQFEAPLSKEERQILNDTPFLGPELSWVDDPDHTEWLIRKMKDKRKAMDEVLEDEMYGDSGDLKDDEALIFGDAGDLKEDEAVVYGVDVGFGLPSFVKKIGRGIKRGAKGVANVATGVVKKFVPGRDAQKVALIKAANKRLIAGRANFLQLADAKAHRPVQPRSYYEAQAKPWAKGKLAAGKLPTSFASGVSGEVAVQILGEDVMGSWWNPFSWFQGQVKYVVQNAQGEMAEMNAGQFNALLAAQNVAASQADPNAAPTDPNAPPVDPNAPPAYDPSAAPPAYDPNSPNAQPAYDPNAMAAPPPAYDPSQDPSQYGDPSMTQGDDDLDLIFGDSGDLKDDEAVVYGDPGDLKDDEAIIYGDAGDLKEDEAVVYGENGGGYDLIVGHERHRGRHGHHHRRRPDGRPAPAPNSTPSPTQGDDSFAGFAADVLPRPPAKLISPKTYRALTIKKAQSMSGSDAPSGKALVAAHARLSKELPAKGYKVKRPADVTGAWLYQLNPGYWLKSSRERHLIDLEKENWERQQAAAKYTGKHRSELEAGKRALYQAEQARSAEAESQAQEAQLKDIEQSLSSSGVGGDSILGAAQAGRVAAKKNAAACDALATKLESGQKLTPDELTCLRSCLKMCGQLKKLHAELHSKVNAPTTTSGYHDDKPVKSDFLGEDVTEILGGQKPITKSQWIALTAVATSQPAKLPAYAKQQGVRLSAADMTRLRQAVAKTKQIMAHPAYSQAKFIPPTVSGDDSMGFSWTKLLTAPLAALALPAAALTWGASKVIKAPLALLQYGARKGGWQTPGTNYHAPTAPAPAAYPPGAPPAAYPGYPPGAPPAAYPPGAPPAAYPGYPSAGPPQEDPAARARRLAAYARVQAAQAQSDAAQQQLMSQADAADAEASALEAEAQARSDQRAAEQAQYDISPDDSQSGVSFTDAGSVTVLGAECFSGVFVESIDDPKTKKIVEEAQKNTTTGKKIRAGATLYQRAKKGDPKARLAIYKMEQKAKKGDAQAKRDTNAVKAGKIALQGKTKATRKIAAKSAHEARAKRVAAGQKKLEAGAADRLIRASRKHQLAKVAHVERRAAAGDKHAKKVMAVTVARAKKGDKKAQANVAALRLARHVRTSAKTPSEARRLKAAGTLVAKANRGHKKSIRQIALINAAAKAGQPNAKRAKARIQVAARVERTLSTGKVHAPATKSQAKASKATQQQHETAVAAKRYEFLKQRVRSGVGTREEAVAAAKLGSALAKQAPTPQARQTFLEEASALALRARKLRPAGQPIKDTALVAAAAEKGDKGAQAAIQDSLAAAEQGDPRGIASAGHLAAAQAVGTVQRGGTMSPQIAEATGIVERAHAGDPEAKAIVARAGAAAQDPTHPDHSKAVEAAVALTAASAILAATASRPSANKQWKAAARKARGQDVKPGEEGKMSAELDALMAKVQNGTATRGECERARELAMALGKVGLAAQISALMPPLDRDETPLSSLPAAPLGKISGAWNLVKASLAAIFFATPDPFENYREGVRDRGASPLIGPMSMTPPAQAAGDDEPEPDKPNLQELARKTSRAERNVVVEMVDGAMREEPASLAALRAMRKKCKAGDPKAMSLFAVAELYAKSKGKTLD